MSTEETGGMLVEISDNQGQVVSRLVLTGNELQVDGDFPGGLTPGDLASLGFVYYENDARGEPVARVKEVPLSNSLEYLRALMDALPPGYHLSTVKSEKIERERLARRERFEQELTMLDNPEGATTP